MSNDYLPTKDNDLLNWSNNFVSTAYQNLGALGLTEEEMTAIQNDIDLVTNDIAAVVAAKSRLASAAKLKDNDTKTLRSDIRVLVKGIQAKTNVPDELKKALQISVPSVPGVKTPPITPTSLVANPQAAGINSLSWKAMGNKTNTQYVVYVKPYSPTVSLETDAGWTMVGQTTRRKFDHMGVTPGQPLAYKVVAARADQQSNPSLPVTVYTS